MKISLIRPLWAGLPDAKREPYRSDGDAFRRTLAEVGLTVEESSAMQPEPAPADGGAG